MNKITAKAYRVSLVTAEDVEAGVVKDSLVYFHSQVPNDSSRYYFVNHPDDEEGYALRMNQVIRESLHDLTVTIGSDDASEIAPVNDVSIDATTAEVVPTPQPPNPALGMKYDGGKPRPTLLMRGCAWAIQGISSVLAFGAAKYAADSWRSVPNATDRYTDALLRHLFAWMGGEKYDEESGMPHLWHAATNMMFIIELTRGDYEPSTDVR